MAHVAVTICGGGKEKGDADTNKLHTVISESLLCIKEESATVPINDKTII